MPIGLIAVLAGIVGFGVYIIINAGKPKKQQDAKKNEMYRKLYKFLSSFFLSQQKVLKIYSRIAMLSVYGKSEMMAMTTKYYLMSTGISIGMIAVAFFLFKDVLSSLICTMFGMLVSNILVDKQLDSTNYKVYKSLGKAISSIRQEYMRLGSIPEAIESADYDPIIRRPMEEIHTILTTSNGELKLHEFYESTPFRTIQTLAGICYNINNSGDTKDETGNSNFIQSLTLLAGDINSEIKRIQVQKQKFGKIEYLPFAPIFAMTLIESYFSSIMPGTALIYKGPMGYLSRTIILVSCIISYSIVSRINSTNALKEDDRDPWVLKLLENRVINNIVSNIVPKGRKAYKAEKKLKSVLSKMNIKQLYAKKLVFSACALVLSVVTAISTISLGKEFIRTSTQQLSLVASNEMDEYSAEAIRTLDKIYLESEREFGEEELKLLIKTYMPNLSDLEVIDQQKRLEDKKKNLENAYFKWWYMWICFLISVIAFFGPDVSLVLRKYIVETEAEEDFLQLQTLVSILMNTDIDTLDTLGQLCQHSRIHKEMLLHCYHSYPANPEKELARLKSKTPIIEFKRFIGKLELTVSDLSLKESFSDLIMERQNIVDIRNRSMDIALDKKRGICGPLSMTPIALLVIGELLLPLGILGVNEFMKALSSM